MLDASHTQQQVMRSSPPRTPVFTLGGCEECEACGNKFDHECEDCEERADSYSQVYVLNLEGAHHMAEPDKDNKDKNKKKDRDGEEDKLLQQETLLLLHYQSQHQPHQAQTDAADEDLLE